MHNAQTLMKQVTVAVNDTGYILDKLVITQASDLEKVDTACFELNNNTFEQLTVNFNHDDNTLVIEKPNKRTFHSWRNLYYL